MSFLQNVARNALLSLLDETDFYDLEPHFSLVDWKPNDVFVMPHEPVDTVWFPICGLASVVAVTADGRQFEVGMYGREGVGPASVLLGDDRTPHRHIVRVPGAAYVLPRAELLDAMRRSRSLTRLVRHYVDAFSVQTGYTALSATRDDVEVRLARWLLMCRDRVDGDDLPLAQACLGIILGVPHASVASALSRLVAEGLVDTGPGYVHLRNRDGLKRRAGDSYGLPEAEYRRLVQVAAG